LTLAGLLHQVVQEATEQCQQAARLPDGVRFDFDPWWEDTAHPAVPSHAETLNAERVNTETVNTAATPATAPGPASRSQVLKTARRTVVSLAHGRFQAREIVRHHTTSAGERRRGELRQLASGSQSASVGPNPASSTSLGRLPNRPDPGQRRPLPLGKIPRRLTRPTEFRNNRDKPSGGGAIRFGTGSSRQSALRWDRPSGGVPEAATTAWST
jgi:hypothetical protein